MLTNEPLQSASFDPQTIAIMTAAHERACRMLNLTDRADPLWDVIAKQILALATRGEREPRQMSRLVLEALGKLG
jgi:hypothetical protein